MTSMLGHHRVDPGAPNLDAIGLGVVRHSFMALWRGSGMRLVGAALAAIVLQNVPWVECWPASARVPRPFEVAEPGHAWVCGDRAARTCRRFE